MWTRKRTDQASTANPLILSIRQFADWWIFLISFPLADATVDDSLQSECSHSRVLLLDWSVIRIKIKTKSNKSWGVAD